MELKSKKVAVLGLSEDGISIIRGLVKRGALVSGFGTSGNEEQINKIEKSLKNIPVKLHWKSLPDDGLLNFDFIVFSTQSGKYRIPREVAKKQGVKVLSDLDLATSFMKGPLIAVTGTNGKTSTVAILREMLKKQGFNVAVTGGDFENWGERISDKKKYDFYILELSSRRLENSTQFHPHIAVLLNIFPAHSARHRGGLPAYLKAKAKVFLEQTSEDYLIHEASAVNVRELIRQSQAKARRVMFSLENPIKGPGVYKDKGQLVWTDLSDKKEVYPLAKIKNKTPTFLLNLMAALAAAKICKVQSQNIQAVIDQYPGLPFRLEKIRNIGKLTFVDDSRATNAAATIWAISSFNRPVILIMGGALEPRVSYEGLVRMLRGRVKLVILIGSQRQALSDLLGNQVNTILANDLKGAVEMAYREAEGKEAVLFSPACPPDLFTQEDGTARGESFKKFVAELPDIPKVIPPKSPFVRI